MEGIKLFQGPWTQELLAKQEQRIIDILVDPELMRRLKVLRSDHPSGQDAKAMIDQLVAEGWVIVEETTDGHPPDVAAFRTILERPPEPEKR